MSDRVCRVCRGSGRFLWSDSGMGEGPGGQMLTEGPCPGWRNGKRGHRVSLANCPHWPSPYDDFPDDGWIGGDDED